MTYRSLRIALCGALALALNVLLAPAAQAGAYVGKWDPPYGAPFDNLGWRGEAKFDIPAVPGCNADGAACVGGASVTSAQVLFYDVALNANIAQIDWNAADLAGVSLLSLQFSGNDPVQFSTTVFPFKFPQLYLGVDGADYGGFDLVRFGLDFDIDTLILPPNINLLAAAAAATYSGPLMYWDDPGCEGFCGGRNDLIDPNNRPRLVVTRVPEPGSIALLAGALLAAGVATRRRRG